MVKGITAVISVSITDLTRAYVVLIFSLLNARIASKLDPVITTAEPGPPIRLLSPLISGCREGPSNRETHGANRRTRRGLHCDGPRRCARRDVRPNLG